MATQPAITESQWDPYNPLTRALNATITANDEAPGSTGNGWLASNLGQNGTKDQWKTTNVTGTKTVKWQRASAATVSLFILHRHNGSASGTFRFRVATSEANLIASPLYDSTALSLCLIAESADYLWKTSGVVFAPVPGALWAQLDISDASNPDGVFLAGRAIIGEAFRPTLFAIAGESEFYSPEDYSAIDQSPTGFDTAVPQEPRDDFVKTIVVYTKAEAERLRRVFKRAPGLTGDVAAVHNPAAATLGDLNMGVFRFRSKPKAQWNARTSENDVHVKYKLDLKAVV